VRPRKKKRGGKKKGERKIPCHPSDPEGLNLVLGLGGERGKGKGKGEVEWFPSPWSGERDRLPATRGGEKKMEKE